MRLGGPPPPALAPTRRKAPHLGCHPPAPPPVRPSPGFTHCGSSRTGRRGNCNRAAFRARAVPETAGGRRAGQSELRLPRHTGKSQPADRSHNSAHGREIPCALTGEAGRSRCLSGRRAGRHRPPGGQRAHRCRFHPRPGHPGGEPARHHVFGASAYLRARRRLRQRASRPPLLFRGNQARPFGGDGSLPPGTRCHRRRP